MPPASSLSPEPRHGRRGLVCFPALLGFPTRTTPSHAHDSPRRHIPAAAALGGLPSVALLAEDVGFLHVHRIGPVRALFGGAHAARLKVMVWGVRFALLKQIRPPGAPTPFGRRST